MIINLSFKYIPKGNQVINWRESCTPKVISIIHSSQDIETT